MNSEIVDYRKFRLKKLNTEEFRHLKLLIFWPLFGAVFWFLERGGLQRQYFMMYCALDDLIPFCEYFLIPYLFWFVFIVGMLLYTLLLDVKLFRRFMYFVMITYSVTLIIYILFPSAQNLRPTTFADQNLFTVFLSHFYKFDTNTNVCPSLHVIGSLAVMAAAWHSRHFHKAGWRIAFTATAILISVSTVFLKQHSVLDIFAAMPVCVFAWLIVYPPTALQKKLQRQNRAADPVRR